MATGLVSWSTTAASNATADSNVNMAEGMAPSAVNDGIRAAMASMAKWREDNNGSLTTAGTSTAFTVTTNQTFAALSAGLTLRLKFNAACGASPTLNVDGLGAAALQSVVGTALSAGQISANAVHDVVYTSSGTWLVVGVAISPFPSGTIMLFRQTAAPTGWTKDATNFNNNALRATTGAVSSGGSVDFTSAFTSRPIGQGNLPNVTLTGGSVVLSSVTATPGPGTVYGGHTAATVVTSVSGGSTASNFLRSANLDPMAITIGGTASCSIPLGGSGTPLDFAVKYVDIIFASKD